MGILQTHGILAVASFWILLSCVFLFLLLLTMTSRTAMTVAIRDHPKPEWRSPQLGTWSFKWLSMQLLKTGLTALLSIAGNPQK